MIHVGILGCSEIAYRRFMSASKIVKGIRVTCTAEKYDKSKLDLFCQAYGLRAENSFEKIIHDPGIDAVYTLNSRFLGLTITY